MQRCSWRARLIVTWNISAQIVPGPSLGRDADCCQVNLIAWRDAGMDDARWLRLVRCHQVEILLIQARLAVPS